jgi:hypothetical protein
VDKWLSFDSRLSHFRPNFFGENIFINSNKVPLRHGSNISVAQPTLETFLKNCVAIFININESPDAIHKVSEISF